MTQELLGSPLIPTSYNPEIRAYCEELNVKLDRLAGQLALEHHLVKLNVGHSTTYDRHATESHEVFMCGILTSNAVFFTEVSPGDFVASLPMLGYVREKYEANPSRLNDHSRKLLREKGSMSICPQKLKEWNRQSTLLLGNKAARDWLGRYRPQYAGTETKFMAFVRRLPL